MRIVINVDQVRMWCAIALLAGLILACVPSAETSNADHQADLVRRAGYDFGCPADQLALTILQYGTEGEVRSYGVSGCGHTASYILADGTWVANVIDRQVSGTPLPTSPSPPPVVPYVAPAPQPVMR